MMEWEEVAAAVAECKTAYAALLESRANTRAGTKKRKAVNKAWEAAHYRRQAALRVQFDKEKDRIMPDGEPSLSSVLQRYYAETIKPTEGRKRK